MEGRDAVADLGGGTPRGPARAPHPDGAAGRAPAGDGRARIRAVRRRLRPARRERNDPAPGRPRLSARRRGRSSRRRSSCASRARRSSAPSGPFASRPRSPRGSRGSNGGARGRRRRPVDALHPASVAPAGAPCGQPSVRIRVRHGWRAGPPDRYSVWRVAPPGGGHLRGPSLAHGRGPDLGSGGSDSRARHHRGGHDGSREGVASRGPGALPARRRHARGRRRASRHAGSWTTTMPRALPTRT